MRIRVAKGVTIQRGVAVYSQGEELELPDDEAQVYVEDGRAKEVKRGSKRAEK